MPAGLALDFFFIHASGFMRNGLVVVWATIKTVDGAPIFVFLIKLMASIPYPMLFKYNPLIFKQLLPTFLLSTTSISNMYRRLLTFFTLREVFPLSDG